MLSIIQQPNSVIEHPIIYDTSRKNANIQKTISYPLAKNEKAPSVSNINLNSDSNSTLPLYFTNTEKGNQALVYRLQRYLGNSDDVDKYSREERYQRSKRFNEVREESNQIFMKFLYYYVITIVFLLAWFLFF